MGNDAFYLMSAQKYAALYSDDPLTKVGAVIVPSSALAPPVYGANSYTRGVVRPQPDPEKHRFIEHAERAAIARAAASGISTTNATMYLTWFPCADCARSVVNAGIERLVCGGAPDFSHERYGDSFMAALHILRTAHVRLSFPQ